MSFRRARHRPVGVQAGIFDTRPIASYILDLLQKCCEIHEIFNACRSDLEAGRDAISQNERSIDCLQTSLQQFDGLMDGLSTNVLQENVTVAKMSAQIDALRKEIGGRTAGC